MNKNKIAVAVFAVIAAASTAMAQVPQINFDGRNAGAVNFAEAIKAVEIPQNISPAETIPSKSDILIQQYEFYKLNGSDRKKLQEAVAATSDTAMTEMVGNEELSILFSRYAVVFNDRAGKIKPLSDEQNKRILSLVYKISGSTAAPSARVDMDNSTWMQPVCVKWGTQETTILKKVCTVVNAYVNGGWVGTLVCQMIPETVTVRVCEEYQSGI